MDQQEALENARRYYALMERHGASIVTGEYREPLVEDDDDDDEEEEDEEEEGGEDSQEESYTLEGDERACGCPLGERCMCDDESVDEDVLDERRQRFRTQKTKSGRIKKVRTKRTKMTTKLKGRRRYKRKKRKIKREKARKQRKSSWQRMRKRVAKKAKAFGTRAMSDRFMDAVEENPKLFKRKEDVEDFADEVLAAEGVFFDLDEFDGFVEDVMFRLKAVGLLAEAAELPGVRHGGVTALDDPGTLGFDWDMTSPRQTVVFGKPLMPYLDNLGYSAEIASKLSEMAPTQEHSDKLWEFAEFCESFLDRAEESGEVDEDRLKEMCAEASAIVSTAFREFRDAGVFSAAS